MSGVARVVAWWCVTGLLAWAVVWSMADRLARHGVLLDLPPALLSGGDALVARAWAAYRAGDLASARALSRRAVARRPADATALRVAGLIAIASGEAARGDALMRLAGAAGWRDRPTQLYWAEVALAGGALDVAAERIDAVLRVTPAEPRARALAQQLEASPAGRAALLRRIRVPNAWAADYLTDMAGLSGAAADARLALIDAATAAGRPPDSERLDRLGWALVRAGRADVAQRLAPGGDFRPYVGERAGPFAWSVHPSPGLDANIEPRDGRNMLRVTASAPALLPVASRMLRLPPGPARFDAVVAGARTTMPLVATLTCADGGGADATPAAAPAGRFAVLFTVPAGCPAQTLTLTLSVTGEEARRGTELWISAPRVSAVP